MVDYNSAAEIYVPGAEGGSAYSGSRDPFLRGYSHAALIDVYVYRGSDGRCLGTFYLPFSKQRDPEAGFQDLAANTGSVIIQKILGVLDNSG